MSLFVSTALLHHKLWLRLLPGCLGVALLTQGISGLTNARVQSGADALEHGLVGQGHVGFRHERDLGTPQIWVASQGWPRALICRTSVKTCRSFE